MWAGIDPERVKAAWREDLSGLTQEQIARGLEACRTKDWPPSAPEFRNMCLGKIDYERAYTEASQQWYLRQSCADVWSDPAIFWAAAAIGNDVMVHPYRFMANRWREELDAATELVRDGRLSSFVPPRRVAIANEAAPVASSVIVRRILQGAE